MTARLDHLVVVAQTLGEGVAWCEATLGITPGPGGEHPLMGTHNRLFRIDSAIFPAAYFEILAINNKANYQANTVAKRWFDMEDVVLAAHIKAHGPQLIHWVASVPQVNAAVAALGQHGIDRGPAIAASRMTANGLLQWQITVRQDGQRLFNGCLPTLIQWGDVHPVASMPASGVSLQSLHLVHPHAELLNAAFGAVGLDTQRAATGPAELAAMLITPKGVVRLTSAGI